MSTDNKVALATGAGSEIGKAIAERLALSGVDVGYADFDGDAASNHSRGNRRAGRQNPRFRG